MIHGASTSSCPTTFSSLSKFIDFPVVPHKKKKKKIISSLIPKTQFWVSQKIRTTSKLLSLSSSSSNGNNGSSSSSYSILNSPNLDDINDGNNGCYSTKQSATTFPQLEVKTWLEIPLSLAAAKYKPLYLILPLGTHAVNSHVLIAYAVRVYILRIVTYLLQQYYIFCEYELTRCKCAKVIFFFCTQYLLGAYATSACLFIRLICDAKVKPSKLMCI